MLQRQVRIHPLEPGQLGLVVFSGSIQWHYRDPLPAGDRSAFCHLLVFHFHPAGMSQFINPADWEDYFDIPGLGQALPETHARRKTLTDA